MKLPQNEGVVIIAKFEPDMSKGWGFIEPAGTSGARETNVFFNSKSVEAGQFIQKGDIVSFVYSASPRSETELSACRVTLKQKAGDHRP